MSLLRLFHVKYPAQQAGQHLWRTDNDDFHTLTSLRLPRLRTFHPGDPQNDQRHPCAKDNDAHRQHHGQQHADPQSDEALAPFLTAAQENRLPLFRSPVAAGSIYEGRWGNVTGGGGFCGAAFLPPLKGNVINLRELFPLGKVYRENVRHFHPSVWPCGQPAPLSGEAMTWRFPQIPCRPPKGNVINLRICFHFPKEKCVSALKIRLARPNGNAECYPAAIGGSLSRYQVTSSVA